MRRLLSFISSRPGAARSALRLLQLLALSGATILLNVCDVGAESVRLSVDGRERSYLIERPPGDATRPTIIMLHGFGGTGADIGRRTGLDRLGPQSGFVAVFPEGLRNRWNHFLPGKETAGFSQERLQIGGVRDDVGFLKFLVADLVRRDVSDPKRIYLAGFSNGGFMTLRMICSNSELFAAAGMLVSGMPEVLGADCRPPKPIAALMINGTADKTVPYAGGMVQPGNAFLTWPAERLLGFLRQLNDCTATAEESVLPNPAGNKVEVARWTRCAGAPVVFYRVIDGDHGAPLQLNAAQMLLDFFRDKVREDSAVAASAPLDTAARPQPLPAAEKAASIKTIFERYNLLGTFALDCGKPVGRGNRYYVHRLLDVGHVQRDMMSGPTERDFRVIFERAAELRPNEIVLGGTRDGQPVESLYRVEPNRARVLESTLAGRKEISGGRFVNGGETPWMNKCAAR